MGRSRKVLLLVLCLAVCVGMCTAWADDVAEDAKAKAEEAKQFAEAAMHDAKENTDSWADWARDKFSQNLGFDNDHERQLTETLKSAASGASEYASQKAHDGVDEVIRMPTDKKITDAKDTVGEAMGQARERMGDSYEDAKQKMYTASDKASTMARNAKDDMAESVGYGREKAANVYDQGKKKMNMASEMASEKFFDAKDTMENAKGKASDIYDETRQKIGQMASGNNANDDGKIYDVENKVKVAMDCGKDKVSDVYDEAKQRINMASNIVGDKTNYAKDKMGVAMGYGRDKIDETFDQAKHEVGDAYLSAKNTMNEEAKANYEAAKEKASEATGDLGAKMRNSPEL